jgi:hypothetical protein
MSTQDPRADEPHQASAVVAFDLSELQALYEPADLHTLLTVALDEFDCQHLLFDAAFEQAQWQRAAEALHRLAGTVAFFVSDAAALEPLCQLERAMRGGDAVRASRTVGQAREALAAFRAAFTEQLAGIVRGVR